MTNTPAILVERACDGGYTVASGEYHKAVDGAAACLVVVDKYGDSTAVPLSQQSLLDLSVAVLTTLGSQ